jgi:hypothetical protein
MKGEHPKFESGERAEHLRHAAECAACREKLLDGRPERIFMLLGSESPPADKLELLTAEIGRRIESESSFHGFRQRMRTLLPVAASIMLAGLLGIYSTINRVQTPLGRAAAVEPYLEASSPSEGIELISSPGDAQVMEFTVGETQIVMIFDEALDI